MRKNSKNIISLFVIISIITMPFLQFSNVKKANAQSISNLGGSSASGIISGLLPSIIKFPGCIKHVKEQKIANLFEEKKEEIAQALSYAGINILEEKATEATNEVMSIQTTDLTQIEYLSKQNVTLETIKAISLATKKSVASMDKNDNCFNAIGKAVVNVLIKTVTLSIVDWINGKNSDGPLFLTNPSKFFKDIAKEEILSFGQEIQGTGPFAKAFLINQARLFNQRFADNARYSLNEMIRETNPEASAISFTADFSSGGWGAWEALTQVPANNPLGFQIVASNELATRLEGTSKSVAELYSDALQQAGGILGQEICADPVGVTKEEDAAALTFVAETDENGMTTRNPYNRCKKWEYVTPGKYVADHLTATVGLENNALLDAETLNDAIAAILDAAMARFSSTLMNEGMLALSENNNNNESSEDIDLGEYFSYETNFRSQTEIDFPTSYTTQWLQNNPNFNIRTDVTQALVDEQRTYSDKLALQNKELMSTTDGANYKLDATTGKSNAYGLIPTINQLDYCIPGPHPGWEEDSKQKLNTAQNIIPNKTEEDMKDMDITQVVNIATTVLPFLKIPVLMWTEAIDWVTGTTDRKLVSLYGNIFRGFTGIKTADDKNANVPTNKDNVINLLDKIFERYVDAIHNFYGSNMPEVTNESANQFNKLEGYKKIFEDNNNKILSIKNIITRLETIKNEIDILNGKLATNSLVLTNGNTTQQEQYETNLRPHINAFSRLSLELVSGDDIAEVDNMLKQIIDEKNYVYNDLLKGPYGCEQDLEHGNAVHLPWEVFDTRRMTYPEPILYDYNNLGRKGLIPDPWNSGYANHMTDTPVNTDGPGFLSSFLFEDSAHYCGNIGVSRCIEVHDLVDLASWSATVGKSSGGAASTDGRFESIIGVY